MSQSTQHSALSTQASPFWKDRSVFVTGGNGFLGSWLIQALVEQGASVVALVRDNVPGSLLQTSGAAEQVTLVHGDLLDQALLERALGEYEVRTAFHLAAQAIVGVANRNPVSTFETNIAGTWRLLEAARRSPTVGEIVVASSDKAYGEHEVLPYNEDAPLQGRHPYDVSKSCADLIAQSYAATYGQRVGITRCGNLFGGGDLNWNRVVPGTIRSALEGERPLVRSDGSPLRDYLYVEDGVSAYMTLAEALNQRPEIAGRAWNFGHNQPVSVLEIVQATLAVLERTDLTPDVRNEASHEIAAQYLDSTRAMNELNWQPRFSLAEGLRRSVSWYRNYLQQNG